MTRFLVEVYTPAAAEIEKVEARARCAAAESSDGETRVRYLRSIFVPADEMSFHLFEAPSVDAVRKAVQLADLEYARIAEAVE